MDQTLKAEQERVQIHLSASATSRSPLAAARPPGETPSKKREGWRDLLAKAACEVFEIMVGTSLGRVTEESPHVIADFTAMVGIAGSLCGVLSLRTSSESASRIAAKMLGIEEVGVGENVQDALGEVCNMIAGSFKSRIPGLADSCALSVPTVISGKDYALYSLADGERLEVAFSFEDKPFSVTLDLHS